MAIIEHSQDSLVYFKKSSIMRRKIVLLITMASLAMALQAAVADTPLLHFGLNSHDDWVYNRATVILDNTSISESKITLFTSLSGDKYTLLSPTFDTQGCDSLKVEIRWRCGENSNFNPSKVAPRIELIDNQQNVAAAIDVPVEPVAVQQTLVATFLVPKMEGAALLFSAPKALEQDGNFPAVKDVKVWAVTAGTTVVPVLGDVTGDGNVDVSDVNMIINVMLGKVSATDSADVDHSGTVDVVDVNMVINIMLGKQ